MLFIVIFIYTHFLV